MTREQDLHDPGRGPGQEKSYGRSVLLPARALQQLFARLLHPLRRSLARAALRRVSPGAVLFVCQGNICRSPFAEVAFRRAVPLPFRRELVISSAGFLWPGREAPPEGIAAAADRGLDLSGHRSRRLGSDLLAPASVVFVMDTAQRDAIRSLAASEPSFSAAVLVLGDFDPQPIRTRRILDPIDLPREVFDECYARVERCVREAAGAWFGSTAPHSQDNERRGHRSKP